MEHIWKGRLPPALQRRGCEALHRLTEPACTPIAGLFDWSMQHREEGDGPPRPMSEADRHFLEDALKSAMIDLGQRMADIKESLDAGGAGAAAGDGGGAAAAGEGAAAPVSLEDKERLLDELLDIVEQIDLAKGGQGGGAGRVQFTGRCTRHACLASRLVRTVTDVCSQCMLSCVCPPVLRCSCRCCMLLMCEFLNFEKQQAVNLSALLPCPLRPAHHWRPAHNHHPAGQPAPLPALACG